MWGISTVGKVVEQYTWQLRLPGKDLDGKPRIADGDGIAIVDMGAYEYVPPPDPWAYDENEDGKIQKSEAIDAVQDYFGKKISKGQAIEVVMLYFG